MKRIGKRIAALAAAKKADPEAKGPNVAALCRILGCSRQAYYNWPRYVPARRQYMEALRAELPEVFE